MTLKTVDPSSTTTLTSSRTQDASQMNPKTANNWPMPCMPRAFLGLNFRGDIRWNLPWNQLSGVTDDSEHNFSFVTDIWSPTSSPRIIARSVLLTPHRYHVSPIVCVTGRRSVINIRHGPWVFATTQQQSVERSVTSPDYITLPVLFPDGDRSNTDWISTWM